MFNRTRRNRNNIISSNFFTNTKAGVQNESLSVLRDQARTVQIAKFDHQDHRLEDRVMPVVNLSVSDITIVEGDNGTSNAVFTVTRSGETNVRFTVDFSTSDGTALDGTDYVGVNNTLYFDRGVTSQQIVVPVIGNKILQNDKSFNLRLENPKTIDPPPITFGTTDTVNPDPSYPLDSLVGIVRCMDLNGDGFDDIVSQAIDYQTGDDGVRIHITNSDKTGNSTELFQSPEFYLVPETNTNIDVTIRAIQLGDLDGDNRPELIIGFNDNVVIVANSVKSDGKNILDPFNPNSNASLITDITPSGLTLSGVTQVLVCDFNYDGINDLIISDNNGIYTMLNVNNGSSFIATKVYNGRTDNIESGDIDGDGRIDVVGVLPSNQIIVISNVNSPYNIQKSDIGFPAYGITINDFNNDGVQDVALQSDDGSQIEIVDFFSSNISLPANYYNRIQRGINSKYYYLGISQSVSRFSEIASCDLNQDGFMDLVLSAGRNVLLGNGDFTFSEHGQSSQAKNHIGNPSWNTTYVPDNPRIENASVCIGDINVDGVLDIITNLNEIDTFTGSRNVKGTVVIDYGSVDDIIISPQFVGNTDQGSSKFVRLIAGNFDNDPNSTIDFATSGRIEFPQYVNDGNNFDENYSSSSLRLPRDLVFFQPGGIYPRFSQLDQQVISQSDPKNEHYMYEIAALFADGADNPATFLVRQLSLTAKSGDTTYLYAYSSSAVSNSTGNYEASSGTELVVDITGVSTGDFDGNGFDDYLYIHNGNEIFIKLLRGQGFKTIDSSILVISDIKGINQVFSQDLDDNGSAEIIVFNGRELQILTTSIDTNGKQSVSKSSVYLVDFKGSINVSEVNYFDATSNQMKTSWALVGVDSSNYISNYRISPAGLVSSKNQVIPIIGSSVTATTADLNNDGILDYIQFSPFNVLQMTQDFVDPSKLVIDRTISLPYRLVGSKGTGDFAFVDVNKDSYLDLIYSTSSGTGTFVLNTTEPVTFNLDQATGSCTIQDDDSPVQMFIDSGDQQITGIGNPFKNPLSIVALNINGNPVSGAGITFSVVSSSVLPSGIFVSNLPSITDINGVAISSTISANMVPGLFSVTAQAIDGSVNPSIDFVLESRLYVGYSINNLSINEGDFGQSILNVVVNRTGETSYSSTITISTSDATAVNGIDYLGISPEIISFSADELTKSVQIPILGNTIYQPNRQFLVNLTNPTGEPGYSWFYLLPDSSAIATILDDDRAASMIIDSGNQQVTGTSMYFPSNLGVIVKNSAGNPVSNVPVHFIAYPGSNNASGKFDSNKTVLTGAQGLAVSSPLQAENKIGNFTVLASVSDNSSNSSAQFEEEVIARVSYDVKSQSIIEGDIGTQQMKFTVSRSGILSIPTSVQYLTKDITAIDGVDYQKISGTLNFAANESTKVLYVPIIGNTEFEDNRKFELTLFNPSGPVNQQMINQLPTVPALGEILDDDNPTYFSIVSGDGQAVLLNSEFSIALKVRVQNKNGYAISNVPVTFELMPNLGGYDANFESSGVYYSDSNGIVQASQLTAGKTPGEFFVKAIAYGNGFKSTKFFRLTQRGSISYSVADSSVVEGDGATSTMQFTVRRSGDIWLDSSVEYQTLDGTAIAGSDYVAAVGRLNFGAGETEKTISVTVLSNRVSQTDRTFELKLTYPANDYPQLIDLILPSKNAVGTIFDDDSLIAASRFGISSVWTQPTLTSFIVQNGIQNRSSIRYVDMAFNLSDLPAIIAQSFGTSSPRIRIVNTGLSGNQSKVIPSNYKLTTDQNNLRIDFGNQGIGGNSGSSSNDGVYRIDLDLDGNGSFETSQKFFRLLGDIDGNGVVDSVDNRIFSANRRSRSVYLFDVNGDNRLDNRDSMYIRKAQKRRVTV